MKKLNKKQQSKVDKIIKLLKGFSYSQIDNILWDVKMKAQDKATL